MAEASARPLGELVRELEARGAAAHGAWPRRAPRRAASPASTSTRARSSRAIVFVAVPGVRLDGHDFAAAAVERGAVAVIAERAMPRLGVPQLLVGSSRSALASRRRG